MGFQLRWSARLSLRAPHLSSLFTKSPKPGVSTTVSLNRTPFSSMSAEIDSIVTVFGRSTCGGSGSLRGYSAVLRGEPTSGGCGVLEERIDERRLAQPRLADDHRSEREALADRLAVHLIRQVREACELSESWA